MALPWPLNQWIDKLNTIIDFFVDPCDAPVTVYVQTLFPALLEAAITYWAIDPTEILANWARPSKEMARYRNRKKGRRGPKGAKKAKWGKLGKVLSFDFNEWGGKGLQSWKGPLLPIVNGSTVFLWRIFGLVQIVGFWWMVWEIFLQFWVRWSSLLHETHYCQASMDWVFLGHNPPVLIGNVVTYNPVLANQIEKQRGEVSYTVGGGNIADRSGTIMVEVTVPNAPATGESLWLEIWIGLPGVGNPVAQVLGTTIEDTPLSLSASAPLPPNSTYYVTTRTSALLMTLRTDSIMIFARG